MRASTSACTQRRKKRSPDWPTRGNDVNTQILERVSGVGWICPEDDEEVEPTPPSGTPLPSVNYFVAYVSPGGQWHLAFGDGPILNITHWMPLPELPQGSAVV
jgi:hypothetical protein